MSSTLKPESIPGQVHGLEARATTECLRGTGILPVRPALAPTGPSDTWLAVRGRPKPRLLAEFDHFCRRSRACCLAISEPGAAPASRDCPRLLSRRPSAAPPNSRTGSW